METSVTTYGHPENSLEIFSSPGWGVFEDRGTASGNVVGMIIENFNPPVKERV